MYNISNIFLAVYRHTLRINPASRKLKMSARKLSGNLVQQGTSLYIHYQNYNRTNPFHELFTIQVKCFKYVFGVIWSVIKAI